MLNPADILDALVAKLKAIPALVTAMTSASNIVAYHDSWPTGSWFQAALVDMKAPGILAVWRDTGPGQFGAAEVWKHSFSLIVRPPEEVSGSASYGDIFALIVSGVPVNGTPTAAQALVLAATGVVAKLVTDTEGGGISVAAKLYVHEATPPTVNNTSAAGAFYGYAMETVGSGLTDTIDIMHVQGTGPVTSEGGRLLNEEIHPGCYPMDVPTFTRQTLMVTPEASLDYFEVRVSLAENGDN